MHIIIAGGGDIGKTIAGKLISEGHDIVILEKDPALVAKLQSEFDAMVIAGQSEDVSVLLRANVKTALLMISVTHDDNVNILVSLMAKTLNPNITTFTKITNSHLYFTKNLITKKNFLIDKFIDPLYLCVDKIMTVIQYPNAIEMISYEKDRIHLLGIRADNEHRYEGMTVSEISKRMPQFKKVRIVAIYRNNEMIIPEGYTRILASDKMYFIGKIHDVKSVAEQFSKPIPALKKFIIVGGGDLGFNLAQHLIMINKDVTIIESDADRCNNLADKLDRAHIINGSMNDSVIMSELDLKEACFIAVTKDDEYNIISSASAKRNGAMKAICIIRNSNLFPIVTSMPAIDSVFSPNILTVGEILGFCRTESVISVSPFSQINAETIEVSVAPKLPIINKPFRTVKFPSGIVIGAIIRGNDILIPSGDSHFEAGDKAIIFLLHSSVKQVQAFFKTKRVGKS